MMFFSQDASSGIPYPKHPIVEFLQRKTLLPSSVWPGRLPPKKANSAARSLPRGADDMHLGKARQGPD
jgi:hypothetical protein